MTTDVRLWIAIVVISATASAQTASSSVQSDGVELLERASRHYADAKSYHIRAVEDGITHNELQRSSGRTVLDAAADAGNKFRYEGRSGWGSELRVSDGMSLWTYNPDEHLYTKKVVVLQNTSDPPGRIGYLESQTVMRAKKLHDELSNLSGQYKSATRLPDATVDLNGHAVRCYVVRVRRSDLKRSTDDAYEETIWIAKRDEVFVKRALKRHRVQFFGDTHVVQNIEITTTYPVTNLRGPLPDSLFAFVPSAGAALVDAFPTPLESGGGSSLTGLPFPVLKSAMPDGSTFSTASLKGKVILLDVWATWCPPCVRELEQLASIYLEAGGRGMALVTIDEDEDAEAATALLAKKGYVWQNIHDSGEITKAMGGAAAVPRTLVVDRDGKVVYDSAAPTEADIRRALAKLGPEFASLAPKVESPVHGTEMKPAAPR